MAKVSNLFLFVFMLAGALWFVKSLQGIDADTVFLSVYFAALATFIVNAFVWAFKPHF
jgi:hypothetical protein